MVIKRQVSDQQSKKPTANIKMVIGHFLRPSAVNIKNDLTVCNAWA